jgi:hypothetical protein
MRYSVKLVHQIPDLTGEESAVAEEAFCDCLAFSLGGEEAVLPAYRAWQAACCAGQAACAEERVALARWQTAQADATCFALKPLDADGVDAYFEISVEGPLGAAR